MVVKGVAENGIGRQLQYPNARKRVCSRYPFHTVCARCLDCATYGPVDAYQSRVNFHCFPFLGLADAVKGEKKRTESPSHLNESETERMIEYGFFFLRQN